MKWNIGRGTTWHLSVHLRYWPVILTHHGAVSTFIGHHLQVRFLFSTLPFLHLTLRTRYFKQILFFLSSTPFYTSQVQFPTENILISATITQNPCFSFFCNCISAVDGTHIRAFTSIDDHPYMHNCKGYISQNCLFICGFNFSFVYTLTGWDGLTADAKL